MRHILLPIGSSPRVLLAAVALTVAGTAALGRLGFTTDGATENFKPRRDAGDLATIGDMANPTTAFGFDHRRAAALASRETC